MSKVEEVDMSVELEKDNVAEERRRKELLGKKNLAAMFEDVEKLRRLRFCCTGVKCRDCPLRSDAAFKIPRGNGREKTSTLCLHSVILEVTLRAWNNVAALQTAKK